ncbi:Protein F09A5.2 [Aphelenchoides avenae]|nr:Protein F09A5.2 [Aphelenchus avenae]
MKTESYALKEIVTVGNASVDPHNVILINKTRGIITPDWSAAGIAGLLPYGPVSSIANLFLKNQIALFYGKRPTFKGDNTAGSMTFGGIDSMYCEEDGNVVGAFSQDDGILFQITSITLGNEVIESGAVTAVVILETKYTTIPLRHLEKIASATGAVYDNATERYIIECARISSLPDITLQLSGKSYYMGSAIYTEKVDGRCYFTLLTWATEPGWLLGTSFTQQYCHVMNYQTGTYELHMPRGSIDRARTTTAATPQSATLSHGAVAAIACGCTVAVLLVVGVAFFIYYKRRIRQRWVSNMSYRRKETAAKSLEDETDNCVDKWELKRTELEISGIMLGEGSFGTVFKGKVPSTRLVEVAASVAFALEMTENLASEVAVKMLHRHVSEDARKIILREIETMKQLGYHEHIVNLVGCVSTSNDPILVMELCAGGDLLSALRRHRNCASSVEDSCKVSDSSICLTEKRTISIAWQVCDGMAYLASQNFVHRDLAARNILLTERLVAKISDFGLCIRADQAPGEAGEKVPIKWTAPEALRSAEFCVRSDVWNFGVLLFEIFSMGGIPYSHIDPNQMLSYLESEQRMEKPEHCPNEIYEIMTQCWHMDPQKRPLFEHIRNALGMILDRRSNLYGYLDTSEHYLTLAH